MTTEQQTGAATAATDLASWTPDDLRWMRRALRLAARGYTPPNPMVGCVIVRDGQLVGEGYHAYAGAAHAEAAALAEAGERARGAAVYVTLEPCSHHGRTPPCADALVLAGVARVVASVQDSNPAVAGSGLRRLREAGVGVETGLLADEARELNAAFFRLHETGRPLITLKAAMTLDGKIATHTGDSKWVSGERARAWVHRLRARCGAVLCGVGTVVADDPLLTARVRGVPRQPLRVVIDPSLRIPVESRLVQTARESPVLIFAAASADPQRVEILQSYGLEIVQLKSESYNQLPIQLDLTMLVNELGRRGVVSVLVEGGGETVARFLAQRCADRLVWFIAPKLVGGRQAPSPVEGAGVDWMADALTVRGMTVRRVGADLLVEGVPDYGSGGPKG